MSATQTRVRRSRSEWDDLANEIIPALQSGAKTSDYRDRIGASEDALKVALARHGFDPHGNPLQLKEITARTPKALARSAAKRRREGAPWWLIQAETDEQYGKIVKAMKENGFDPRTGKPVENGSATS